MKRFYKFLMPLVAIVAMALPWNVQAQSLTVANGTATSTYIPFYGTWMDADQHNQVLYPSSMISGMAENYITSMTFYMTSPNTTAWNADVIIRMKEVTDSVLTALYSDTTGFVTVWTGTVNGLTAQMPFYLDVPFAYEGGNLLVDITTEAATYNAGTFGGVSHAGGSFYSYNTTTSVESFLPKTTFTYNATGSICLPPSNFSFTFSEGYANFTWADTVGTTWEFVYGASGFDPDGIEMIPFSETSTSYALDTTNFTPGYYDAYVRTNCGDDNSAWVGPLTFGVGINDYMMAVTGTDTLRTCNATIYDDGGADGQYSTNCNATLIITPNDPTKWVTVSGTSHTEGSWDYLTIYDGIGTTGEMLWNDNISGSDATLTFGPFSSSAITVTFYSDGSVVKDGFQINVSCVDAPACPRPAGLTATNVTPDSIYLSISDDVNSEWVVVYGLSGFNPDTAVENVINTTDNFASIGGLLANTPYDIYVMASCPDGGYSLSRMITVRTACANIDAVPVTEDFEGYGSGTTVFPSCWYRLNSTADRPYIHATTSYGHNNTHGLYFYAASGGYCYGIMPAVDASLDITTLQVRFWARQYGTSYNCDFVVGVMTDPTDASTFTAIESVHPAGITYEEFEVPLASYTGTGAYIAFKAIVHPGYTSSQYIYLMLDDVTLELAPSCVRPTNVEVYNVTNHEATISWDDNSNYNSMNVYWGTGATFASATDSTVVSGDNSYTITGLAANTTYHAWVKASCDDGDSREIEVSFTTDINCHPVTGLSVNPGPVSAMATWTQSQSEWTDLTVEYKEASDTAWTSATTTNNYFPMTGLTPATEYNFRIIATCVEGTSVAATANFRTTNFGCLVADSTTVVQDTIGTGTSTSSYFPTYSLYNYSLTQQIYLASDFSGVSGGQIEHIGIQMSAVPVARNIEIYMTNTSATDVSSAFIPIAESDLVWSGSTTGNIAAGWNDITLATPFNYTGGNILVTFRDMTGSWTSGNAGMVTTATSGISRYVYQDGSSYSVTAPPSGGYASSERLNMYFLGGTCLTQSTCAAPVVVANPASTTSIELSWVPGASETSWLIYQRLAGDTVYTLMDTVNATTYTATGLNPGLDYEFQVVAVCGDNDMAGYAIASTECAPVAVPYTEDFERDYGEYSRNCWTIGSTYLGTSYPIPYVISLTGDPNKLCLIYNGGYMIMPEMDAQLNTLQARFTLVQGGDNVRLIIGLMSDPTASIQNIIPLDTLIRSEYDTSSSSVNITFPFDMLPDGATGHITFWDAFADNYSFIDNLVIEPIPACVAVTGVSASNVTSTDATISWDAAGASATGYLVEYGPRNFTPGNGTVVNATTNSITLTGLTHSSDYDVYVYTICAGLSDTSINSNRARFSTSCDVATLPYFENFDNCADPGTTRSPLPNCWSYTMLSSGTYAGASYTPAVYYTTTAGYTSSGDYCLYLYGTALTVLPEMPTTVDSLYISFHHYTSSPASYRLIIGAVDSITPGFDSSFVAIDTLTFRSNENNVLRFLSTYTGTGRYIAFKNYYNNNSYDYSYHYIDDLEVGYMPSCVWPVDVHATGLTTTTAEFAWSICQASDYEYEYGPAGFTRGTGTTGTWNSAPYGISGLTLGTQYDIYVRGICGAGDTSEWSSVYTFSTLNADPATVPYYCDFTDTTLTNSGWEVVNGTQNNQWVVGSAESNGTPRALYISNDNGATNAYTNTGISITYAYRDVILTDGQYTLSYDWKANGESSYDYIRAWLVPASQIPVAGYLPDGTTSSYTFNSSGVAPAGWISIDGGVKLNLMTSWQSYEEELNLTAGTYHLLFMWANDGSGGTNPPAAIDNVLLALNVCPISDITLVSASASSMQISWSGSSDSYELEYGPAGFTRGTGVTMTTTATTANLTGLSSLTNYDIYLRGFCNVSDTSRWYRASFSTEMCDNPGFAQNWDTTMNTGTSSYSPIGYSTYNYSYVQTIIDSAQLADLGGDITAFAFYPASTSAGTYFTNMDVYMANVSESDLSSGFIMPDSNHTFVQVLTSADLSYSTTDEQVISMDVPFIWDGHSNIMIAFNRQHGAWTSGSSFNAHTHSASKMRYVYNDDNAYSINTVSGGTASSTVGDIKLIACASGCYAPEVDTAIVGETEVTLQWTGTAANYEVAAMEGTWSEPIIGEPATGNTATITGLTPGTPYSVGVRAVCGEGLYSDWFVVNVTTIAHPCYAPTAVTATNPTFDGATIAWTVGEEGQSNFELHITAAGVDTLFATTSNPVTVTGLPAATAYTVTVRAICGEGDYSEWSTPANFSTATCQMVEGVRASATTATTATITWTANGSSSYEVAYGITGTSRENCRRLTANTNSITINGLDEATTYDVYVRSVCTAGVTSDWSDVVTFETQDVAIDDVDNASISLYPNPASSTVTLTGIEGDATVTVVDMNGRESGKWKVESGKLTIDVTGYAQGAYFVRITGERVNAIRKLIVR